MPIENVDTEQLESARVQRAVKELFNQLEAARELAGQIKRLPRSTVTAVNFRPGADNQTAELIVKGQNFQENDKVELRSEPGNPATDPIRIPPTNTNVVNATRIEVYFDSDTPVPPPGDWRVVVINQEDSESKCSPEANCIFTIQSNLSARSQKLAVKSESQVTAVYPDHVDCPSKGETKLEVGIVGKNFTQKMNVAFEGNDIKVEKVAFKAPELLIVSLIVAEKGTTGARDVTVTDPVSNQSSLFSKCFTVNRPAKGGPSASDTAESAG